MTSNADYVPLPGSERNPLTDHFPQATDIGAPNPDEQTQVSVILRPPMTSSQRAVLLERSAAPLDQRSYISREELADQHGADQGDIAKIEAFAQQHNLHVVSVDPARRTVVLSGTLGDLMNAFRTDLTCYQLPSCVVRARTGPLYVPAELEPIVQAVTGLDTRPQVTPKFVVRPAQATGPSYTPVQVAQAYDFPANTDGSGQCIGILEFGGGFSQSDLQTYFSGLGMPVPSVTVVSVDGAQNAPTGDPAGPDGEVLLDIEVAGAIAPGARIAMYFAPNTDQGFIDAVTTAIHDTTNKPDIISISWGGPESTWTPATMQALNQAFQNASLVGITVYAAAGDSGSSDGTAGNNVDYPASDPYVGGCGGTTLQATGGTIKSEVVWNDPGDGATGGGVSAVFARPSWQSNVQVPPPPSNQGGRGVPDVAGDASPTTGYQVVVDGQQSVYGGTSAVAPLWAGLTARLNQQLSKPLGLIAPLLYGLPSIDDAFHDITSGNNGAYQAGPGWDPCTGLGSPDGARLANALGGTAGSNQGTGVSGGNQGNGSEGSGELD